MMTATTSALVARLAELLSNERFALADFIAALATFDRERRWGEAGYANLYDFLVRELRMSKGTAFYRKVAVELVQRYPEVLEALRDGRLCITAVHALSKAITLANRAEVLPRFFHVSKQEAKVVAAEIAPATAVPRREVLTPVRSAPNSHPGRNSQPVGKLDAGTTTALAPAVEASPAPAPSPVPSTPPRTLIEPLTAQDRRLHLTVTPEFLRLLDACKDAVSHTRPGADAVAVLEEGMRLILARDAKKKAIVARPRPPKGPKLLGFDTRYIPAELRREVWERDQGKCQYPLERGGVCGSTFQPELDHIDGFQPGKPITAKDLRVCCKPHNGIHADEVYGRAYMAGFRRRRARGHVRPVQALGLP